MGLEAEVTPTYEEELNKATTSFCENMQKGMAKHMIASLEYYRKNGIWEHETPEYIFKNHLKFAKGKSGDLVLVHDETMIAYKTSQYPDYKAIEPYEVDNNFQFERWATGFDF